VFLAAARSLGRDVGAVDGVGDRVGETEREERARGLAFEDAILGVMVGKRAGMSGTCIHLPHSSVSFFLVDFYIGRSHVGSGQESTQCRFLVAHGELET